MNVGAVVLVVGGLFGFATSAGSGFAPEVFARQLGLGILNPGGSNEIRAQYSGFFLAVGIVCFAALFGIVPRQSALIVLVTVFGGLLSGRLVSLVIDRGSSGYPRSILSLYAIDSTGLVLSAIALVADKR